MIQEYDKSVFINCPFDTYHKPIFNAVVFAVHDCGFKPRCAQEEEGSTGFIFDEIINMIGECRYGVHDISRTKIDSNTKMAKFNMPLELGIFIGAARFKNKPKEYLIFANYRLFDDYISDLNGKTAKDHKQIPDSAIKYIRNWLSTKSDKDIASGSIMCKKYDLFKKELPAMCKGVGWVHGELTFAEYSGLVLEWLTDVDDESDQPIKKETRQALTGKDIFSGRCLNRGVFLSGLKYTEKFEIEDDNKYIVITPDRRKYEFDIEDIKLSEKKLTFTKVNLAKTDRLFNDLEVVSQGVYKGYETASDGTQVRIAYSQLGRILASVGA